MTKAPEAWPHEPMKPENHPTEIWWRIPCWCGWRGCWWTTEEKGWRSYYRHQEQAKTWLRVAH